MIDLPAIHFYDPVFAIDAHLVLLPTPAGPVPQRVPLIFMGVICDLMDYMPPDSVKVRVNGFPHAHAGTGGLGKHVPMLGKFVRNPANKAEVMVGSSTVLTDDEPMGFGPVQVLTCSDVGGGTGPGSGESTMFPSPLSFVLPLQHPSAQVYVGGTATPSLIATLTLAKTPAVRRLCKGLRKRKWKTERGKARAERAALLLEGGDKEWSAIEKRFDLDWSSL